MKILIITADIGKTAPGIVFEKLIQGMSLNNEIFVLTASNQSSLDLSNVKQIIVSKNNKIHYRISKFLISIFGVNLYDIIWSNKSIKKVRKSNIKFAIVCSFISYHNYIGLICGQKISKDYNIKHAVYSVDAIPAPGWPEDKKYFSGVKRMMNKYLNNIDALFSANKKMLEYQKTTFKPKKEMISDTIYNPSNNSYLVEYPIIHDNVNYFLYTGNIYGVRKSKYLLLGFEMFLNEYPNSKLVFVGTKFKVGAFSFLKESTQKKIEIHSFTRELDSYYRMATALIDIDADIENDVFLSSKIINYLSINRIIISETGKNSPSRELFKDCESILQCNHNESEIYSAMCKATQLNSNLTFECRKKILEKFSNDNIVQVIEHNLRKLI